MVFSIWYLTICALCTVQCASLHIGSGAAWSQYPYTNPFADLVLLLMVLLLVMIMVLDLVIVKVLVFLLVMVLFWY